MNITGREIAERFIRAVEIAEGWYSVGPAKEKAAWVEYTYTQADKNGWGTERLAEERKAFWNNLNKAPRPWEVSQAEETLSWLRFATNEAERTCLMAWARCMASKEYFKDWCAKSGIHSETGRRRKERAILRILLAIDCKVLLHNEIDVEGLLPDTPDLGHIDVNIGEGATHWIADTGRPNVCHFDSALGRFDWAEKQNARRREKYARSQKERK